MAQNGSPGHAINIDALKSVSDNKTNDNTNRPRSIHPDAPYEQRLFQYTDNSLREEPRFLIFRSLQTLNLFRMQSDLAKLQNKIWKDEAAVEEDTGKLTVLLSKYTSAIRDYEYLKHLTPVTGSQAKHTRRDLELAFDSEVGTVIDEAAGYRRFADPDLLPTDNLRNFLKRFLPRSVAYTRGEMWRRTEEYLRGEPPEEVSLFVDVLARFLVAFLGGAMLVVPMLIMRLPEITVVKSLVTVSAAVMLFAGALSVLFRASNTDTIIATATYAAVLVVFVGVSG
ncbi:uncharacterized protein B0H64DRAFT_359659 [Chaetomium fimeti]|uniref:DUF6594 domain-containing protein n=1 Tax=Chaetomium fimeti TaxID=1854472 RepID=A0AAE0LSE4_9PEZI|nr:hypothetical protein B0H64DRAFT_359659 [Chaetomium fimeti]